MVGHGSIYLNRGERKADGGIGEMKEEKQRSINSYTM